MCWQGHRTRLSPITADANKTTAIIPKLVDRLLKQDQTMWIDFCNSPHVARTLKTGQKTDCVGTLKLNQKNVPKKVKDVKLKKGEIIAQHCGSVSVTKWSDRKVITMILT
jgi:hypothetical protein